MRVSPTGRAGIQTTPEVLARDGNHKYQTQRKQVLRVCDRLGTQQSSRAFLPRRKLQSHFQTYGLDQIKYPVEIADIPAIEDMLKMGINVYSFFTDEGKGRHPCDGEGV